MTSSPLPTTGMQMQYRFIRIPGHAVGPRSSTTSMLGNQVYSPSLELLWGTSPSSQQRLVGARAHCHKICRFLPCAPLILARKIRWTTRQSTLPGSGFSAAWTVARLPLCTNTPTGNPTLRTTATFIRKCTTHRMAAPITG